MGFIKFPGYVACLVAVVLISWLTAIVVWYFKRPRKSYALEDASGFDYEEAMRKDDPHMHDL